MLYMKMSLLPTWRLALMELRDTLPVKSPNLKVINIPSWIFSGQWSSGITALIYLCCEWFLFFLLWDFLCFSSFSLLLWGHFASTHHHHHHLHISPSSTHQLICALPFSNFPHCFGDFFPFILISLFSCFFIFTAVLVCDWLRCVMWHHVPTNPSSGVPATVGGSLWSLGSGYAPPGPPAPGKLHRSISWAGTVINMCALPPLPPTPPSENTWWSVFLLTCTIQQSTQTGNIWS